MLQHTHPSQGTSLTRVKTAGQGLWHTGDVRQETEELARLWADKRLAREWRTLEAMIQCYCRAHHGVSESCCPECQGLLGYAHVRLERCRFGVEKPTCAKCPVHCYQRERREQVRTVMRYAGPRMLWLHPVLSLRHWLDGLARRKNVSASPRKGHESVRA